MDDTGPVCAEQLVEGGIEIGLAEGVLENGRWAAGAERQAKNLDAVFQGWLGPIFNSD
jgi:hypothetical protein